MMRAIGIIRKILGDSRGATAVEYGLIVALVVIAMIGALESVANENTGLWARVRNAVDAVMTTANG
jgi:pilus assembly protein Flp/PilA